MAWRGLYPQRLLFQTPAYQLFFFFIGDIDSSLMICSVSLIFFIGPSTIQHAIFVPLLSVSTSTEMIKCSK